MSDKSYDTVKKSTQEGFQKLFISRAPSPMYKMIGSILIYDFKDEVELQWYLDKEPYVVWDVWKDITVHKCNTRDPWQFNRPKEFFENRK